MSRQQQDEINFGGKHLDMEPYWRQRARELEAELRLLEQVAEAAWLYREATKRLSFHPASKQIATEQVEAERALVDALAAWRVHREADNER